MDAGASVVVIDDFNPFYDPAIKEANLRPMEGPRLSVYKADIRDAATLARIFDQHLDSRGRSFDGIIHLAARAGVRPSLTEPYLYLQTNVDGTFHLAELARVHRIKKFIFASSSSVYGDSPNQVPFREDQDISRPISPYAASKAMAENLLYTYHHLYSLNMVILRFFTVYGPGQRPDLAIHKFTRLIDQGQPLPVFGDGSTRRDYTYIDDILQGIAGAIEYDKTPYEVFNLGESQTVTLTALIQHIESALGKSAILHRQPLQPGDVSVTYADISKAQQLLNYQPTTPISIGIPRFVEWYLSQKQLAGSDPNPVTVHSAH